MMNFYYHPILGLQYKPTTEIETGRYQWTSPEQEDLIWVPCPSGRLQHVIPSKSITTNATL